MPDVAFTPSFEQWSTRACSASWLRVITLPARPFGYNALVVKHQSTTRTRVIMSLLNEWGSVMDTREGIRSVPTYFHFYL